MNGTHTTTALRRWGCQDKPLPSVDKIKSIHVYDFDNTLFLSPLPNKQIWNSSTFGQLQAQDFLYNGGWWHNSRILAATGHGIEIEEPAGWEGRWNETIKDLVNESSSDDQAISILLTGRREAEFSDLIGRMINSQNLEFDLVVLKPDVGPNGDVFNSTMVFKQTFLRELVHTYTDAAEIRIYEDRIKHVKAFRDFFADINTSLLSSPNPQRQPILAEVIQVSEEESHMDPTTEVAEVQRMINVHNRSILDRTAPAGSIPYKIKRSVFYTGYIIQPDDIERLKTLVKLPPNCPDHEIKYLANNILITPRPAPPSILDKVGGIGAKMTWRITGIATLENRVWAARVAPTIPGAKYYTENHTPCVVLATRRQAKPIEATQIRNWQPVPGHLAFEFETHVGEKVLLRIEEEFPNEDNYEASFPNARNARKHPREEEFPPLGGAGQRPPAGKAQARPQMRSSGHQNAYGQGPWQNGKPGGGIGFAAQRGGGSAGRGGQRGGQGAGFRGRRGAGGGGRGGRGRGGYRSLDDNVAQSYGGSMQY